MPIYFQRKVEDRAREALKLSLARLRTPSEVLCEGSALQAISVCLGQLFYLFIFFPPLSFLFLFLFCFS